MSKSAMWKKDRFLGLAAAVVLSLLGASGLSQHVERKAYEAEVCATESPSSGGIAVIVTEDGRITNIGRYAATPSSPAGPQSAGLAPVIASGAAQAAARAEISP